MNDQFIKDMWNNAFSNIWSEYWHYIIGFFLLLIVLSCLKAWVEVKEARRRREYEEREFERKVEKFLQKKDEYDSRRTPRR